VVDYTGKPVLNARVYIAQAPAAGTRNTAGPPFVAGPQVAVTAVDPKLGQFSLTLPAGSYIACGQTTTAGLLDPCHWSSAPPGFTVTAGQTASVTVSLGRGTVVSIHVNDPGNNLKNVSGPIDPECRIRFVNAKGFPHEAIIVNRSGNVSASGRDYSITLPLNTALQLNVVSPHLNVNDQTGNAAAGIFTPVTFPDNGQSPAMQFTITGAHQ